MCIQGQVPVNGTEAASRSGCSRYIHISRWALKPHFTEHLGPASELFSRRFIISSIIDGFFESGLIIAPRQPI